MSLFEWLTPEVGAVAIPAGDPGTLRAAAGRFGTSSDAMTHEAAAITAIAEGVTASAWFGIAAFAFRGTALSAAGEARISASAFAAAGSAMNVLAAELEEAQEMARRAAAAAADLNARSANLEAAYASASASETAAAAEGKTFESSLPGLLLQAASLQFEARSIGAMAAAAEEKARDAQQRAAGEFREVALMAPSVQRRLEEARRAAAEAAEEEAEPGGFMGLLHDVAKPFRWAGDKLEDVGRGTWNGVSEPVGMVFGLVDPFDENGFFGDWKNLGGGLWYGVTHPWEFAKSIIGVDMWQEEGFAYWAGNLIPGAIAAVFTGGGSAAMRGTRVANRLEGAADTAGDVSRLQRTVRGADDIYDALGGRKPGDAVHPGRIDLSSDFEDHLKNFDPKSEITVHSGPLDRDIELVQYFDPDRPGSPKWWTSTDEANELRTIDEVHERLALDPAWGERTGVRVIKIPKGTDVTFIHGKAKEITTNTGDLLKGGGEQFRFLDFEEDWIVSTRRIP